MNRKSLNVVVVCGGISSEREISLKSGREVLNALEKAGYNNLTLFDLTGDNLNSLIVSKPDVVYLALHGKGGEDGCIQGALKLAGIRFTGPDVEASAICMNKITTKKLLTFYGLPTPKFLSFDSVECSDMVSVVDRIKNEIGFPVVLKSPSQGSSIGVTVVNSEHDLMPAAIEIAKLDNCLLAERYVDGVELTVPIMGNNILNVLPIIEISSESKFYDFNSKYTVGKAHHIIPARISKSDADMVNEIAQRAYRALGCRGLSRIDFIIDDKNGPMLIEINTLPGMTELSLFPDAARHNGITFPELVDHIIELALE